MESICRRSNLCYALDLHHLISLTIPCSSLSLIRSLTYIKIFEERWSRHASDLEIAAALLISIKYLELRSHTKSTVEIIIRHTLFDAESLSQSEYTILSTIHYDIHPLDMVEYFQNFVDTWLRQDAFEEEPHIYLSKLLSIVIAALITPDLDPRENLMPAVMAFVSQASSSSLPQRKDSLDQHSFSGEVLLPYVVLNFLKEIWRSRFRFSGATFDFTLESCTSRTHSVFGQTAT